MRWDGEPITAIKRTFVRHAEDCDLPGCTPGTVRHFMATMVRRGKPPVPKEQRDVWLGHDEKRTANACEAFDPEYLRDGAFAPFVRPTPQSDPWRHDRGRIVS